MSIPNEDFHEVWWIYSPERHPWGGLRVAHFRKTVDGAVIVIIQNEIDQRRVGVRVWADIEEREGWTKVSQIAIPTPDQVQAAVEARLHQIGREISKEYGF